MIRRRTKARTNASNCPDLALAKGQPYRAVKAERDRHASSVIKAVRADVFAASSVCACCGDNERQSAAKWPKGAHEMNEDPSRAKTRGLPPELRFNLKVCMRICPGCHVKYTANTLRNVPLTEAGHSGSYDVQERHPVTREWVTIRTVTR